MKVLILGKLSATFKNTIRQLQVLWMTMLHDIFRPMHCCLFGSIESIACLDILETRLLALGRVQLQIPPPFPDWKISPKILRTMRISMMRIQMTMMLRMCIEDLPKSHTNNVLMGAKREVHKRSLKAMHHLAGHLK